MHILYGMAGSLYTAKVRAYLRKQGIAFRERAPAHPRFLEAAVPAVGRWIIPILETPEGAFLQDGADILAHFEARGPRLPATPASPVHEAVARLFELFGGEGLLRPAMHYRWNFDAENLAFIKADFLFGLAPGVDGEAGDLIFANARCRLLPLRRWRPPTASFWRCSRRTGRPRPTSWAGARRWAITG